MDLYEVIRREHVKILKTFRKLEKTIASARPAERARLLHETKSRVLALNRMENTYFYPLVNDAAEGEAAAARSRTENEEIERLLTEMEQRPGEEKDSKPLIDRLTGAIEQHIEYEEEELFPLARKIIPEEQACAVAEDAEREKERLRHEYVQRPAA